MGREIRRVPLDWEHPKDERGHYIPMHDKTLEEHMAERAAYPSTKMELEYFKEGNTADDWFGEWNDEYAVCYRPAYTSPPDGYQMYETVSEGTPVSPIFKSKDELVAWLIGQGHSENAAKKFAEEGSVMSMVMVGGKVAMNIDAYDVMK